MPALARAPRAAALAVVAPPRAFSCALGACSHFVALRIAYSRGSRLDDQLWAEWRCSRELSYDVDEGEMEVVVLVGTDSVLGGRQAGVPAMASLFRGTLGSTCLGGVQA